VGGEEAIGGAESGRLDGSVSRHSKMPQHSTTDTLAPTRGTNFDISRLLQYVSNIVMKASLDKRCLHLLIMRRY
jgi:hypothetical protein